MHAIEYTARLGYACPLTTARHYTETDWRTVHEPRAALKRGNWQRAWVSEYGGAIELESSVIHDSITLRSFANIFGFLPPDAETEVRFRCHVEIGKPGKGKR